MRPSCLFAALVLLTSSPISRSLDARDCNLTPGRHEQTLEWNGRNWQGPSDLGAGFGRPFPPGRYSFEVSTMGSYREPDDGLFQFSVNGRIEFDLVP